MMKLIYAEYNPKTNSIDVTTLALDDEMWAWVDAIDSLEAW